MGKFLILSRSENTHADKVEQELLDRQQSVERINFDQLHLANTLVTINDKENTEYTAVFYHHPRLTYPEGFFASQEDEKIFRGSWISYVEWLEHSSKHTYWVNSFKSIIESRNILYQLKIARGLGLKTPDTIYTNNLVNLKIFSAQRKIVIKQGNLGVNFDNKRILTSLIDVSTISPDELRICPCYFQQYIDKKYEVRANVIGNKVYACKIESQKSNLTKIDWRNYDIQNTPHELIILPQKINSACVDIVKQLNLNFGAIDLIVTPAGEYFFLECNSQAHWLWIEELIELPLTKYIVDSMINVGFS